MSSFAAFSISLYIPSGPGAFFFFDSSIAFHSLVLVIISSVILMSSFLLCILFFVFSRFLFSPSNSDPSCSRVSFGVFVNVPSSFLSVPIIVGAWLAILLILAAALVFSILEQYSSQFFAVLAVSSFLSFFSSFLVILLFSRFPSICSSVSVSSFLFSMMMLFRILRSSSPLLFFLAYTYAHFFGFRVAPCLLHCFC